MWPFPLRRLVVETIGYRKLPHSNIFLSRKLKEIVEEHREPVSYTALIYGAAAVGISSFNFLQLDGTRYLLGAGVLSLTFFGVHLWKAKVPLQFKENPSDKELRGMVKKYGANYKIYSDARFATYFRPLYPNLPVPRDSFLLDLLCERDPWIQIAIASLLTHLSVISLICLSTYKI